MLALAAFILAAVIQQMPGPLMQADPARDRALHTRIQEFLDGRLTADRLGMELREYARQSEAKPYKVGMMPIAREKVPKEQLFKLVELLAKVGAPALQAFFEGRLTAAEAAVKLAPFFHLWGGYGLDPPPDADALWYQRRDELLLKIAGFAAP